jgi:hypothetical protein
MHAACLKFEFWAVFSCIVLLAGGFLGGPGMNADPLESIAIFRRGGVEGLFRANPSESEVPKSWGPKVLLHEIDGNICIDGINETDPVSSTQLLISKDFSFCNG